MQQQVKALQAEHNAELERLQAHIDEVNTVRDKACARAAKAQGRGAMAGSGPAWRSLLWTIWRGFILFECGFDVYLTSTHIPDTHISPTTCLHRDPGMYVVGGYTIFFDKKSPILHEN